MSSIRTAIGLAVLLLSGVMAQAEAPMTALARIDPAASTLRDDGAGVEIALALSQPVPYRAYTLDGPPRLVLDFQEIDWTGIAAEALDRSERIDTLRIGAVRPGLSRLVAVLDGPMAVETAALSTNGAAGAEVLVRLMPTDAESFAAASSPPPEARVTPDPAPVAAPRRRHAGDRPLRVALDPGHGGIDPGAEHEGLVEAHLMLTFARELREVLVRSGGFEVVLTRDADIFVPLDARLTVARTADADVFLSLHADALAEGRASGATIYTLSDRASDSASRRLAERHDRADLLAGVDLSAQDDAIAAVLMDLARRETAPRADRLADALVGALSDRIGMHKRPRLEAGFSVLRAADIPSVLIELGFISSPRDRDRLTSPDWRARAAEGIRDALMVWAASDAGEAALLRR